MRFGKTLQDSVYEPWKVHYIDYSKLKKLLREEEVANGRFSSTTVKQPWTDEDEGKFVEELINVQLERVNAFQAETHRQLRDRTAKCEAELEKIASQEKGQPNQKDSQNTPKIEEDDFRKEKLKELDDITNEISELEKYSRINYTGFLKAAKKHDRRRGSSYRVRPLLQVRLATMPFNSEDYSPLLYRLSAMYSFLRQQVVQIGPVVLEDGHKINNGARYKSHKFWIHPENLLEVKTYILRRLPVLVYNPKTSKIAEGGQHDPTITSIYFDNPQFTLYTEKVSKIAGASSLRLRWSGHLSDKPEIHIEKKTIQESGDSDELKLPVKEKYIQPFLNGTYKMEKQLEKFRERQGGDSGDALQKKQSVELMQQFIKESNLQPIMRANYNRTAFQIPGDDRIRISLDTDMVFIREDSLDRDRPCRNPSDWHRTDIDRNEMEYPFQEIKQGEISRFPFALLEIKMREDTAKRTNEWVAELMSSHLLKDAPGFSRFVHGTALLFEDHVNTFPFWLSDLETDIRKDPESAFQEEQEKKAKRAEDELAVGSFLGSKAPSSFTAAVGSPAAMSIGILSDRDCHGSLNEVADEGRAGEMTDAEHTGTGTGSLTLRSLLPTFSSSKYARSRQSKSVRLPPGVKEPGRLIKDSGPVRVEPKVWLANQRTFIKWQHITVLLASLSLGLYNAAGEFNNVARGLAVVYALIAVFAGSWGWWMYIVRSRMIKDRSGKDFDNVVGPTVVCLALVVALCLNFGFKYHAARQDLSL